MPMHTDGSARFYIEIDGSPEDKNVTQALEELGYYSNEIKILGTFKKAES